MRNALAAAALAALFLAPGALAVGVPVPAPAPAPVGTHYVLVIVQPLAVRCGDDGIDCLPPCPTGDCLPAVDECVGNSCVRADVEPPRNRPAFEEAGFEIWKETNGRPGLQVYATRLADGTWVQSDTWTFAWYPVRA